MNLNEILQRQREFQNLCDINIDTKVASEINALSEMYLFKAIEEVVELRKTFPSELNKYSKKQGDENPREMHYELSDVLLFLINFCLVRKIKLEDILHYLHVVQEANFVKIKERKLAVLNDEMLRVPKRVGLGGGELMPKVIMIGQNPGNSLNDINSCWNGVPDHSAIGFFKRAMRLAEKDLRITENDIYFTNIVKEVTENNQSPSYTMIKFWQPFLERELKIVSAGVEPVYLAMGKDASRELTQEEASFNHIPIFHPAYYMRNNFTESQYAEHLVERLPMFVKTKGEKA